MARIFGVIVILVLIVVFGTQVYNLYSERHALKERLQNIDGKVQTLKSENQKLTADIGYFSNLENLVKEFKSLFNYRKPGEKLIIIVPKETE